MLGWGVELPDEAGGAGKGGEGSKYTAKYWIGRHSGVEGQRPNMLVPWHACHMLHMPYMQHVKCQMHIERNIHATYIPAHTVAEYSYCAAHTTTCDDKCPFFVPDMLICAALELMMTNMG